MTRFNRPVLRQLCEWPDARRRTDGLTPIPQDVMTIICDYHHWDLTDQLIRFCKPLVDAIGNLESRNVSLADCMLELLWCAQHMIRVECLDTDDIDFTYHAKRTFNHQFHAMNTDLHWFAMFLHPQCRKLAISQVAKSRTYSDAVTYALGLAKKWSWSKDDATLLVSNIKDYFYGRKPFEGGHADAKKWWSDLYISNRNCPLKSMTVIIHSLTPHSADVERLFSNLGGIQGVKRSRLSVDMFETLGKLRCYYTNQIQEKALSKGTVLHCTSAHTHARPTTSINDALPEDLAETFIMQPVMPTIFSSSDIDLLTPEDISLDEIDAAFSALDNDRSGLGEDLEDDSSDAILAGNHYDLDELEPALNGDIVFEEEDHQILHNAQEGTSWDIESLKANAGIS